MSATGEYLVFLRRLDETNGTEDDDGAAETGNDGQALRDTLRVYGSVFLVLFIIFLILRRMYPRHYNIRSWSPKINKCELAEDQHGLIRWMWELYFVKDDAILEQCGMDALCFLRILLFGFKLSLMGIANAVWLMPVYATCENADQAPSALVRISTSYLPPGSNRFIATVIAAYVIFLFTFHLILKEFEWYTNFRHKFLKQKTPRNYAVYVTGIPDEYRSSFALKEYFRQCFSKEGVLEAHVAMAIPELERKVALRRTVVKNLEHAINLENILGITEVKQSVILSSGKIQQKDAVEVYNEQLEQLNEEISHAIRKIRFMNDRMQDTFERSQATRSFPLDVDHDELSNGLDVDHDVFPHAPASNSPDFGIRRRRLSTLEGFAEIRRKRLDSTPCSPFSDGSSSSSYHSSDGSMDDIERGVSSSHAEYDHTIPPTSQVDIFQSGDSEQTILLSELSSSPDAVDQAAAFENLFFGTALSRTPNVAEPAIVETMPSPIAEQQELAESRSLPKEQGEQDISWNVATIPAGALHENEPFNYSTGPPRTSVITGGDCLNEIFFRESDINHSHDAVSSPGQVLEIERPPLTVESASVHRSLRRNSVRVITQFPQDVSKIAKKAVMGGSNLMIEGSGQVVRVAKDGSQQVLNVVKEVNAKKFKKAADVGVKNVLKAKDVGVSQIQRLKDAGVGNVKNLASYVLGNGDGTPLDAGFVTFTKLSTTHAALQMIHHPCPFVMYVTEAPEPHDIFWRNVGMPHKAQKVGKLASLGLSLALCLFWTIPVSFISSLTEVDSLRDSVAFIDNMLTKAPWLEPIFAQLAPLLLVTLNAFLPVILREFTKLEGLIASSAVEASLFTKMAVFTIIQTFFVSAISGTIWAELSNMMKDPGEIIDLLARSLPAQSEYFLQIMLVDTFVGLSAELLRVIPLSLAWLRRRIGPNLTEKERNTSYMGLPPLAHPWEFPHADVFGDAILYFMIFFVYSAMAPITSFFVAFCLLLLGSGYRHQFFYNYPTTPDSGGKLWSNFISISLSCIVIAEITLTGFLALKKAAVATIMMFPLIGITIMFNFYIRMQHFVVTKHLPTRDCLQLDRKHFANGGLDFSFVKNKYLQPALLEREVHSTVSPVNRGLGESRNTINRRVRRSLALRV